MSTTETVPAPLDTATSGAVMPDFDAALAAAARRLTDLTGSRAHTHRTSDGTRGDVVVKIDGAAAGIAIEVIDPAQQAARLAKFMDEPQVDAYIADMLVRDGQDPDRRPAAYLRTTARIAPDAVAVTDGPHRHPEDVLVLRADGLDTALDLLRKHARLPVS
mgnify:FL=1